MNKIQKLLHRVENDIKEAYHNNKLDKFLEENIADIQYVIDSKLEYSDSIIKLKNDVLINTISFIVQYENEYLDIDSVYILKIDDYINIWYNDLITGILGEKYKIETPVNTNLCIDVINL